MLRNSDTVAKSWPSRRRRAVLRAVICPDRSTSAGSIALAAGAGWWPCAMSVPTKFCTRPGLMESHHEGSKDAIPQRQADRSESRCDVHVRRENDFGPGWAEHRGGPLCRGSAYLYPQLQIPPATRTVLCIRRLSQLPHAGRWSAQCAHLHRAGPAGTGRVPPKCLALAPLGCPPRVGPIRSFFVGRILLHAVPSTPLAVAVLREGSAQPCWAGSHRYPAGATSPCRN